MCHTHTQENTLGTCMVHSCICSMCDVFSHFWKSRRHEKNYWTYITKFGRKKCNLYAITVIASAWWWTLFLTLGERFWLSRVQKKSEFVDVCSTAFCLSRYSLYHLGFVGRLTQKWDQAGFSFLFRIWRTGCSLTLCICFTYLTLPHFSSLFLTRLYCFLMITVHLRTCVGIRFYSCNVLCFHSVICLKLLL